MDKEKKELKCKIVHLIHTGFEKYIIIVKYVIDGTEFYDDYLCSGGSIFYAISNYVGKDVVATIEYKRGKAYITDATEVTNG